MPTDTPPNKYYKDTSYYEKNKLYEIKGDNVYLWDIDKYYKSNKYEWPLADVGNTLQKLPPCIIKTHSICRLKDGTLFRADELLYNGNYYNKQYYVKMVTAYVDRREWKKGFLFLVYNDMLQFRQAKNILGGKRILTFAPERPKYHKFVLTIAEKNEAVYFVGAAFSPAGIAIEGHDDGSWTFYHFSNWYVSIGMRADYGVDFNLYWDYSIDDFKKESNITLSGDYHKIGGGIGISVGRTKFNYNFSIGGGSGWSINFPPLSGSTLTKFTSLTNYFKEQPRKINEDISHSELWELRKKIKNFCLINGVK